MASSCNTLPTYTVLYKRKSWENPPPDLLILPAAKCSAFKLMRTRCFKNAIKEHSRQTVLQSNTIIISSLLRAIQDQICWGGSWGRVRKCLECYFMKCRCNFPVRWTSLKLEDKIELRTPGLFDTILQRSVGDTANTCFEENEKRVCPRCSLPNLQVTVALFTPANTYVCGNRKCFPTTERQFSVLNSVSNA